MIPALSACVADADADLVYELLRNLCLGEAVHALGVDGAYVVPGAHDDVEAGGAGDPGQSQRIATDTHGGRVDYGAAARPHVEHRLGGGLLLVDQHEVI